MKVSIMNMRWCADGCPRCFSNQREERLKVSGKPDQYNDLNRFVEEQTLIRRLVDESALSKLEVDISDNDIPAAVEKSPTGWKPPAACT